MLCVQLSFAMNNLSTFHLTYVIMVNSHLLFKPQHTRTHRLCSYLHACLHLPRFGVRLTPDSGKREKRGKEVNREKEGSGWLI